LLSGKDPKHVVEGFEVLNINKNCVGMKRKTMMMVLVVTLRCLLNEEAAALYMAKREGRE